MSGILDNKKRILDTIVTQAGRAQLAAGNFNIKYVSFTDTDAFYQSDLISGSTDFTKRIYLEASELPQDNITFEADDSGLLKPFKNDTPSDIISGQIVSWSHTPATTNVYTGSIREVFSTGTAFASTSDSMLDSSIQNFNRLSIIGSHDSLFDDDLFLLSSNTVNFAMTPYSPIDTIHSSVLLDVNSVNSLFQDPRLSHLVNFKKLVPINYKNDRPKAKTNISNSSSKTNDKMNHNSSSPKTKQLLQDLIGYKKMGQCKTINFESTSHENNLMCQFFEQADSKLSKLDVIDYGYVNNDDQLHSTVHIFFVGKVFLDKNDCHTFIHLFTVAFD